MSARRMGLTDYNRFDEPVTPSISYKVVAIIVQWLARIVVASRPDETHVRIMVMANC